MKKSIPQLIGFLFAVGLVMAPRLASAQLIIEQGKVREVVKPGQTLTGSITVHNRSKSPMNVVTYWEDFVYIPPYNGNKKFLPAGSSSDSNSGWVSFSPRQFSLAPFAKQKINYTINVPAKASGGYYGVLLFEPRDKMDPLSGVGMKIVSRVGTLFFLETVDRKKETEISSLVVEADRLKGKIHNSGNVILIAKGVYYVMDVAGVALDRGEVDGLYLAPAAEGDFSIPLSKDLSAGEYTLILTFDLEDDVSRVVEVDFKKEKDATYKIIKTRN